MVFCCISADAKMLKDDTKTKPIEASKEDLRVVHTERYIKNLSV